MIGRMALTKQTAWESGKSRPGEISLVIVFACHYLYKSVLNPPEALLLNLLQFWFVPKIIYAHIHLADVYGMLAVMEATLCPRYTNSPSKGHHPCLPNSDLDNGTTGWTIETIEEMQSDMTT